jgi:hypothetical protein
MHGAASQQLVGRAGAWTAILGGALACGVLDMTAALVVYGFFGLKPMRLLQGIAGGLLGPRTYNGGLATALLGLACHFAIALSAAAVYVVATRKIPLVVRHAVPAGILYGVAVYFFMNRLVVPLSRATKYPFSMKMMLIGIAIHICCVGLPISLSTRRFAK